MRPNPREVPALPVLWELLEAAALEWRHALPTPFPPGLGTTGAVLPEPLPSQSPAPGVHPDSPPSWALPLLPWVFRGWGGRQQSSFPCVVVYDDHTFFATLPTKRWSHLPSQVWDALRTCFTQQNVAE